MSRYNDGCDGCGCFGLIFIVVLLFGGIKSCTTKVINGDYKLPKFGSSHVSGGSGGYGTSNGYNVHYQQTTSPNYNSSTKDYRDTNSLPTEHRVGGSTNNGNFSSNNSLIRGTSNSSYNSNSTFRTNPSSSSSSLQTSTSSSSTGTSLLNENANTNSLFPQKDKKIRTCSLCDGTGKVEKIFWYNGFDGLIHCGYCDRTDAHTHKYDDTCGKCFGKGKVEVIPSMFGGETEVFILE